MNGRVHVHCLPGEAMAAGCTMWRRQSGRGSVLLWAMFCWKTLGLRIHMDVTLTRTTYLKIIADHVLLRWSSSAQHNEISTTQRKQVATQWKQVTMQQKQTKTNHNTTKLTQHNGNKPQHKEISTTQQKQAITAKLAQHNWNKPQHSKISTTQRN